MKKSSVMIAVLLCLFGAISIGNLWAQTTVTQPNNSVSATEITEHTLLWEIEGKGIKTSYLYGTLHLLPQSDFAISELVKKAFSSAEQIALELDMDNPDMQSEMMQHIAMKNGEKITNMLSEEEAQLLDTKLKQIVGAGLAMFDTWKPFMVQSLVISSYIEGTPASFEGTFVQMAKQQEKEIIGLETVEYQLSIFDEIPYTTQADWLRTMLTEEENTKEEFAQMVALYKKGDIQGLYGLISAGYNTEVMALMLDVRNQNWIEKIEEIASEKPTFFGVGAGHLAGENGVIQLLRKAGYTVTPVE